jgi:hypothetical protein
MKRKPPTTDSVIALLAKNGPLTGKEIYNLAPAEISRASIVTALQLLLDAGRITSTPGEETGQYVSPPLRLLAATYSLAPPGEVRRPVDMRRTKDLSAHRSGRLTVLAPGYRLPGQIYWLCRCECGNRALVRGDRLRRSETRSCGCLQIDLAESIKKRAQKRQDEMKRKVDSFLGEQKSSLKTGG